MANIGPPPSVVDLLHLGPVLSYIADAVYQGSLSRDILIANQNSQQQQLSKFQAELNATTSAISSSTAQLSANIGALASASADNFLAAQTAFDELKAATNEQIAALTAKIDDVTTLLEATIQAFQGTATLDAQNQMIALLTELEQVTSPRRPRTIGVDLTHVDKTPQPIPAKPGPEA